MSEESFDLIVVGAGILGLASAREAALRNPGLRICVLERHPRVGAGQSGHNSGVLHSGIYYAPESKKAQLCRSGRALMLDYCSEKAIDHRVDGKLIIATDAAGVARMHRLAERGRANGLQGLREIGPDEMRVIEPSVAGLRALHVPEAGVVDFGRVCDQLAQDLCAMGVQVFLAETLMTARSDAGSLRVSTSRRRLLAGAILNCAGLYSDQVARSCGAPTDVRVVPFRGEYWRLRAERSELVRSLIYPVPDPALPFLGVHLTRSVNGEVDAGPNAVLALAREGYSRGDIDVRHLAATLGFPGFWRMLFRHGATGIGELVRSMSRARLVADLQKLVPAIEPRDLVPASTGVRAQVIRSDGRLVDDFEFARAPRSLHVLNAPSPAATASLAIAREIVDELEAMQLV